MRNILLIPMLASCLTSLSLFGSLPAKAQLIQPSRSCVLKVDNLVIPNCQVRWVWAKMRPKPAEPIRAIEVASYSSAKPESFMLALKKDMTFWYFVQRDLERIEGIPDLPAAEPTRYASHPRARGSCKATIIGNIANLDCTGVLENGIALGLKITALDLTTLSGSNSESESSLPSSTANNPSELMFSDICNGSEIDDYLEPSCYLGMAARVSDMTAASRRGQFLMSEKGWEQYIKDCIFPVIVKEANDPNYKNNYLSDPDYKQTVARCNLAFTQRRAEVAPLNERISTAEAQETQTQSMFANDGKDARMALYTRINRHGLLQEVERNQIIFTRSNPDMPLVGKLRVLQAEYNNKRLQGLDVSTLKTEITNLESRIYQGMPVMKQNFIEPEYVASLLPKDSLLVEYQKYRPINDRPGLSVEFGAPRYIALILKPNGAIRSIPLGDALRIDQAVQHAVSAMADPSRQKEAIEKIRAVSSLVIAPLEKDLNGAREVFISPDAELNRIPFAALTDGSPKNNYLSDSIRIRLLTTGRDLIRLSQPVAASSASVLIANPDYSANPSSVGQQNTGISKGKYPDDKFKPRTFGPWKPLPGTANEAELLASILGVNSIAQGASASASFVQQQKSPRILHIATHGFFLDDKEDISKMLNDPLQRSGLVFAGANLQRSNSADDGYLTAAEVTGMDLGGTELVTLSACETARGSVRSGEGVYGLQRALAVAGARSTLLSLWKVDDDLTALFMEEFYTRLKAGEGRADALRNTQTSFRTNTSSTLRDVRVWGAFQLSGDWRPMKGW